MILTKRGLAVLVISVLMISTFAGISLPMDSEKDTIDIFLVRDVDETDDISELKDFGNVIDRYGRFVILEAPDTLMDEFENYEITQLKYRNELNIKRHSFDTTEGFPEFSSELMIDGYEPGTEGLHIVDMIGPVNPEWRERLEDKGVEVINYVPNYAYEVKMTPELAERVEDLEFVDWVGVYQPGFKLAEGLKPGVVNIRLVEEPSIESINNIDSKVEVLSVTDLTTYGTQVSVEIKEESIFPEIAKMEDVYYISNQKEAELHDEMATQIVTGGCWIWDPDDDPYHPWRGEEDEFEYGSHVNQLGYSGEDVVVTVADTGIHPIHQDFQDRVIGGHTFTDQDWEDTHGHGTHCAGSIGGFTHNGTGITMDEFDMTEELGPYYPAHGPAYQSELFSLTIFPGGYGAFPEDLFDLAEYPSQETDTYVHSNSWGTVDAYGEYLENSAVFDAATRDSNRETDENEAMIFTASAGNDGEDGDNTVSPPGTGKNVITVGATENFYPEDEPDGWYVDNPYNVADFSSRGWTNDNRVKPDVMAPGETVISTGYDSGDPGADDVYMLMSGTSMSNPAVAGSVSTVVEWYEDEHGERPSPAMVRALLINSAHELDETEGNTRGPIPNQDEGWGMVNLPALIDPPVEMDLEDQDSLLTTGEEDEYTLEVEDDSEPLRITVTWTDKEAEVGSTWTLKNDLNIEVESPGGDVYRGNSFAGGWTPPNSDAMDDFDTNDNGWDDVNNVQNVYIHPDDLEDGEYTVRVIGENIPEDANNDGEPNQDYALAIYNSPEDPLIDIERPMERESFEVGEEEEIIWSTVEGSGNITEIDLEYSVDGGESWGYIVEGHDDTGSYLWEVPDEPTEEALIRGTVHDDVPSENNDTSGEFIITRATPPDVTLLSPDGGEEWHAGEEEEIVWNSEETENPIDRVDLLYSTDDGSSWEVIAEDIDDTGTHPWEIPDVMGSESLVRVWVFCEEGASGYDTSEDHFDLVGYLPEPPENLDVEWWSWEESEIFYDDVSEDKGYDTWESDPEATEWDIRQHGAAVGSNSWDWGDGDFEGLGEESRLISPDIELPEKPDELEQEIVLTFQHWYNFHPFDYHGGNVKFSVDGGPFELIEPEEGYPDVINDGDGNPLGGEPGWDGRGDEWHSVSFDLTEYAGETINIRWNAGTCDTIFDRDGWRVDDITITRYTDSGTDHNKLTWESSLDDPVLQGEKGPVLHWRDNEVASYNIYRSEDVEGPWGERETYLDSVEADGSDSYTFVDEEKGEADDIWWWYNVRAVDEDGREDRNNRVIQEPNSPGVKPPSDPEPYDGAIDLDQDVELSVEVEHEYGDPMDVLFYDAREHEGELIGTAEGVHSGERGSVMWEGLEDNTQYEWYTVADDGDYQAGSDIWTFSVGLIEPSLQTRDAEDILDTSATLKGVIRDLGTASDVEANFEWRETGEDDWETTPSQTISSTEVFTEGLTGLDPETGYEFRAVAEGDGIEKGEISSFSTLQAPFFEVTIDDYDEEVFEGEEVIVEYTVNNTGEVQDTQDIEFRVDGEIEDIEDEVTLQPEEEHQDTFFWLPKEGDAGERNLRIESEDQHSQVIVTVLKEPFFEVEIEEYDDKVVEGEGAVIAYSVINEGDVESTQEIEFTVNDEVEDTEVVTLADDEVHEDQFIWETEEGEIGEYELRVSSDDDFEEVNVHVLEDEAFNVIINDHDDQVIEEEVIVVSYEVINTREDEETQEIEFRVDGEIEDTETVTLTPEGIHEDEFSWQTEIGDAGERNLRVESEDDEEEVSVTVLEKGIFRVDIIDYDDEVVEGDEVLVEYTVFNTGEEEKTHEIEFRVDGGLEDTDTVTLSPQEIKERNFTWQTEVGDAGESDLTVSSEDHEDEGKVIILEYPFFHVDVVDYDPIGEVGEDVDLYYTVTNIGEVTEAQEIEFRVDGELEDSEIINLEGGETGSDSFSWVPNSRGEYGLSIHSDDDEDEVSVVVYDILIEDWHDLDDVRNNPGGDYALANDIDEDTEGYGDHNTGDGWVPIDGFSGLFDGMGNTISDLYIDRDDQWGQGLFGSTTSEAEIIDVGVLDVDITSIDSWQVGALVGENLGTVRRSYSSGVINTGDQGDDAEGWRTGGLVGDLTDGGVVENSYSHVTIEEAYTQYGGLVGIVQEDGSTLSNSYSTGDIYGDEGGLVGTVRWGGTVENSFWDVDSSGTGSSAGGTGMSTEEMKDVATFTDLSTDGLDYPWDFVGDPNDDEGDEDIWDIDEEEEINDGYPIFSWQMDYGVSVVSPEDATENSPGTYTYEFDVKNVGENEDTYDLQVDETEGWDVSVQNTVSVLPGLTESVPVDVTIPEGADDGNNIITLTADSQNSDVSDWDSMQVTFEDLDIFSIELDFDEEANGWNFVSFNVEVDTTELTEILDDPEHGIQNSYDKVMYYDSIGSEWLSYIPGRDDHFNNLENWDHTMGIWIRMNEEDTLTVEGTAPTSTEITLNPGWNMVGLPSTTSGNHGLPEEVSIVGHFDASQDNNLAYVHDPDNFEFVPGEGYYLYNDENYDVIWTVEY